MPAAIAETAAAADEAIYRSYIESGKNSALLVATEPSLEPQEEITGSFGSLAAIGLRIWQPHSWREYP